MFTIKLSKRFVKELKNLKKKFCKIEDDLDALFLVLSKENIIGNKLQNLRDFEVYKARLKNSSSDTGKSGGFRVIYYLKRENKFGGDILALTIYSKSQRANISKKEILDILETENLI